MKKPDPVALLPVIHKFSIREFGLRPDLAQDEGLVALISEVLWGERDLWAATEDGLVTLDETATGVADRIYFWLITSFGLQMPADAQHWPDFRDELKTALFSAHSDETRR